MATTSASLLLGGLALAALALGSRRGSSSSSSSSPRSTSLDEVPITEETRTPKEIIDQAEALTPSRLQDLTNRYAVARLAITRAKRTGTLADARAALEAAEQQRQQTTYYIWPIDAAHLLRVGEGLGTDRRVGGVFDHAHQGRDLFGRRLSGEPVPVVFPVDSIIRGVFDWRNSPDPSKKRAGLTVEAFELGAGGKPAFLWRFLHLGTSAAGLDKGRHVRQGDPVGTLAPPGTSGIGLGTGEHLHLERRTWPPLAGQTYGTALDPIAVLPVLQQAMA